MKRYIIKNFIVNIIFSDTEFRVRRSKNKESNTLLTEEKNSYQFFVKTLTERAKILLSLVCDFPTEISIRLCGRQEMQTQNNYFRKKNYPTDILSFPNRTQNLNPKSVYLGDILICLPVCLEQAISADVTLSQELEKMLIHGIVHLKGFDHEIGLSHARVMVALEKALKKELEKDMGKPDWCQVT